MPLCEKGHVDRGSLSKGSRFQRLKSRASTGTLTGVGPGQVAAI